MFFILYYTVGVFSPHVFTAGHVTTVDHQLGVLSTLLCSQSRTQHIGYYTNTIDTLRETTQWCHVFRVKSIDILYLEYVNLLTLRLISIICQNYWFSMIILTTDLSREKSLLIYMLQQRVPSSPLTFVSHRIHM